jgi:outer membrane scaffolding protein for murein synthesis (MipA/OmpV family)
MILHRLPALLAAALLPALPITAAGPDDTPLVPLPSVLDFTRGDGWGVALGVGLEYEAAYDGSDEYELEIDPAGAVHWRRGNHLLFWEGIELGWRARLDGTWLVQTGARYEDGLEPDDSDDGRLDGFVKRDNHIVGFLELRRALDDEWRSWIGARVMGGERSFGWLGVLAAGHRFTERTDGLGSEAFLFTTFGNDTFITKDFGVTAADAAGSGLPETELSGGYRSVGLNLIDRRRLTNHLQLISQAGIEAYSSDIQDSPVARDDYEAEIGLSLVYHF